MARALLEGNIGRHEIRAILSKHGPLTAAQISVLSVSSNTQDGRDHISRVLAAMCQNGQLSRDRSGSRVVYALTAALAPVSVPVVAPVPVPVSDPFEIALRRVAVALAPLIDQLAVRVAEHVAKSGLTNADLSALEQRLYAAFGCAAPVAESEPKQVELPKLESKKASFWRPRVQVHRVEGSQRTLLLQEFGSKLDLRVSLNGADEAAQARRVANQKLEYVVLTTDRTSHMEIDQIRAMAQRSTTQILNVTGGLTAIRAALNKICEENGV